jgi:hypothetical protein
MKWSWRIGSFAGIGVYMQQNKLVGLVLNLKKSLRA